MQNHIRHNLLLTAGAVIRRSRLTTAVVLFACCLLPAMPTMGAENTDGDVVLQLHRDHNDLQRTDVSRIVSFADVMEQVTPAVVSVSTARKSSGQARGSELEDFLRRLYGLPPREGDGQPAPREERLMPEGRGSGFIVTDDGYILTNNHVIVGRRQVPADEIVVKLMDGREFDAEVIGTDPDSDVAVLKINAENLPAITLGNSDNARVGDIVFAAGNPLDVGLTVTQGIVSALGRSDLGILGMGGYESFIQTDAAINLGNSGGPLIDAEGRVIGISTAIMSRTGGSIGIGFAIPINLAASVMESLVNFGEVKRGFMGVELQPIDRRLAEAFGLDSTRGALVARVTRGLPADLAGIRHGDVVLSVNGRSVESVRGLIYLISNEPPGADVSLGIMRGGELKTVTVTLGDRDELLAGTVTVRKSPRELFKGIEVEALSDEIRGRFNIDDDIEGLVVVEAEAQAANTTGLRPGMVIIEINGRSVNTLEEASDALHPEGRENALYVYFQERYRLMAVISNR